MNRKIKSKTVFLISLVISGMFIFFLTATIFMYNTRANEANALKEEMHIEMISLTSTNDSAEIHSVLLVSHENWAKSDGSVPLMVVCPGMFCGPFSELNFAYTLVNRNWAVLLIEYRGHEASSVPYTLGLKEPGDIIQFIDYIEDTPKFNCVNISNSGVVGISLGASMGMLAYIHESKGEGRLKAIAASSGGGMNLSRGLVFYSTNPSDLGDCEFVRDGDDKNPVKLINSTFPKNVLVRHGTEDTSANFKGSEDFMRVLDPYNNRTDVRFDIVVGAGHEVAGNPETRKNAISWVENYTIHAYDGLHTNVTDVELMVFNGFSPNNFILYFQITCLLLIFIIPLSLYFIRPELFKTKNERRIQEEIPRENLDRNKKPIETIQLTPNKQEKFKVILGFLIIQMAASLVQLFLISDDIFTEAMISVVFYMCYVMFLYFKKFPTEIREWCKQSINPRIGTIVIISALIAMVIYHLLPNIPIIEEQLLFFGVKITWFFPYFLLLLIMVFVSSVFLARYLLSGKERKTIRILEPFVTGALLAIIIIISKFTILDANLFGLPLVLIFIGVFSVFFIIMDFLGQYSELKIGTMIIIPITFSIIPVMLFFSSYLIYIIL